MDDLAGYFDYAASTPLDTKVKNAMEPYFVELFYNPSAQYKQSRLVASRLKEARSKVASILGSRANEIVFTAGASEANNLAIAGIMSKFPKANMIVSAIEHDSVIYCANNFDHKICPVDKNGIINLDELKKQINKDTVLVSVMLANNEIGSIQPIKKVAEIIADERQNRKKSNNKIPIYLHSDCAQAVNYLDININRLGVDLMGLNGGKIYGPKQSGALYVNNSVVLSPLIYGGGQEKGLRSGTENIPNIIGFSLALEISQKKRKSEAERLGVLQKYFVEKLKKDFPEAKVNGSIKRRLPNNVHITFIGSDNERMMMKLDELGFQVAVGSACSASSDEPSHVLKALGLSRADIQSSLRFTMGRYTTKENIDSLVEALKASVRA